MPRVAVLPELDQPLQEVHLAAKLIAHAEHPKRRMVAVGLQNPQHLLADELVARLVAADIVGPLGGLGLEQKAHAVGGLEGGLGWAP